MNDALWPFLQTKTKDHLQRFFLKKLVEPVSLNVTARRENFETTSTRESHFYNYVNRLASVLSVPSWFKVCFLYDFYS